jgi:hypothetical protein
MIQVISTTNAFLGWWETKIENRMSTFVPRWGDGTKWGAKNAVWGPKKAPEKTMSTSKVTYPANEVVGFCASTAAMLTKYKAQMIAAKIDPTDLIAKLPVESKALSDANDVQEGIKTQLKDATKAVNAAVRPAYDDCSKGCDMVITAFGRGSSQAQEAINLRKGVRPASHHETPAPATTKTTP